MTIVLSYEDRLDNQSFVYMRNYKNNNFMLKRGSQTVQGIGARAIILMYTNLVENHGNYLGKV